MEGEFVEMGKLIGAGLACTGMGGAAIGVGHVVGLFVGVVVVVLLVVVVAMFVVWWCVGGGRWCVGCCVVAGDVVDCKLWSSCCSC